MTLSSLASIRIAITVFPGSNCDRDMMVAVEQLTNRRPALVWHKETRLDPVDLVIVPGGFSFGDYLRCGALAGRSPVMNAVMDHAARGGAVLGICNGFQVLTETGMLPGVLIRNTGLRFSCRMVRLETAETMSSPFTQGLTAGQLLDIPVAHNEGNYFADDDTLDRLQDNGRIAFRYIASDVEGPANPNGAARDIAGILSTNGRIMGMMPHPERAISPLHGSSDGAALLSKSLEALMS
jgi:phosphoribosylformylglycinamidine synthase I